MELKGSKTEANLMAAFAGESQARNRMMRRTALPSWRLISRTTRSQLNPIIHRLHSWKKSGRKYPIMKSFPIQRRL